MKAMVMVIALLLITIGAGSYAVLSGGNSSSQERATAPGVKTVNVVYDTNGFQPRQITVARGSTVVFENKTQIPMWVASNPHPDHTDYPAFDAGVVEGDLIAPGNPSFSFTFDTAGTWSYHNHGAPEHQAVITVI